MCPCDPNDNTLNPTNIGPPFNVPGFGISIGPINLFDIPNWTMPFNMPDDMLAMVKKFFALFPSFNFKANLDDTFKTPLQAIMNIISQLTPFLALYKFFLALLNMIVCIIEVLCGLVTGTVGALKRLFKQCLPLFLNLFPWLALILMIIALILLLIALIEYIIMMIIKFIKDIIKNLKRLSKAVGDQDTESVLIIAQKISNILCLIQGFLAVFIALEAVWSIIRDLSKLGGKLPCSDSPSEDNACCTPNVCPPFIKYNQNGIAGNSGNLTYYPAYSVTDALTSIITTIRPESWQFYDDATGRAYNIKDIITPIEGSTFWPENLSMSTSSNIKNAPYLLDMTALVPHPEAFNPADTLGPRKFVFKDIMFGTQPYNYVLNYLNSQDTTHVNGTTTAVGGLVFEYDGTTPYMISGAQATINTFIHRPPTVSPTPLPPVIDDGYHLTSATYTWRANSEALFKYNIVTAGCLPEIAAEREVNLAVFGDLASVASKIQFPNILGAYDCLAASIDRFRKDVSEDNALVFQAECETCLNILRDESFNSYRQAIAAGFNPFNSTISLDTNLQFIKLPIKVKITLRDISSNPLNIAIPSQVTVGDVADEIAKNISATTTLGSVGTFVYDGYDSFIADLNSEEPGSGTISVAFQNNTFQNILNRENLSISTSLEDNVLSYTFVGGISGAQPEPRRDVGDIARDAFNGIG